MVIVQRSFLAAAIAYIALVSSLLIGEGHGGDLEFVVIALELLIIAISAHRASLRALVIKLCRTFPAGGGCLPIQCRSDE